jgi:hypothetical protein
VESESQIIRGGWSTAVVQIQYFSFNLKKEGGEMRHCQKMKRTQRARLGSMRRKCDMTQWCIDVDQRRGGTGEGKRRKRCQLG